MKKMIIIWALLFVVAYSFAARRDDYMAPFDYGRSRPVNSHSGEHTFDSLLVKLQAIFEGNATFKDTIYVIFGADTGVIVYDPSVGLSFESITQTNVYFKDHVLVLGNVKVDSDARDFLSRGRWLKLDDDDDADSTGVWLYGGDGFLIVNYGDTLKLDAFLNAGILDLRELQVLFASGWMKFDQMKPATNDSSNSSIGAEENPYGKGWYNELNAFKVKPRVVYFDLYQDEDDCHTTTATATGTFHGAFDGVTADSIIIDSMLVFTYTSHNDVYIDAIEIQRGYTRADDDGTVVFTDGTDIGSGSSTVIVQTYTPGVTVSKDWRLEFNYDVATAAAGGSASIYSIKLYCHYQ